MIQSLFVVLPIFALIAIGYGVTWSGIVQQKSAQGLSDFVFVLAIPCLLFKTLAKATIPEVQPWGYWLSYFGALALVWALAMLIAARVFKREGQALAVAGFAAAQSNTVLVGIPIIVKAYGEAGAVPLALLLAVHLPVTVTLATVLAERRNASPYRILKSLISHPIIIGILLGSAARPFIDILPQMIWTVVDGLAGAAIPCSLVALGMTLRRYGLETGPALPAILSGLKLLVHPALVLVLATYVFSMPPAWSGVAVLFAACPCGINAYLFAERYKTGIGDASSAIALSTLASIGTMAMWLWIMGVV
jgi:malonate transporter and related proteins